MTTNNRSKSSQSHHGVLMSMADKGVLIIGPAGIGKSSLALELLYQNHQLIADDIVDISLVDGKLQGHCPAMLKQVLHCRELGLISLPQVFGNKAWLPWQNIDYIIKLSQQGNTEVSLAPPQQSYSILGQKLPMLSLSINNPASLSHRIQCWLTLQQQPSQINKFKQRQKTNMAFS